MHMKLAYTQSETSGDMDLVLAALAAALAEAGYRTCGVVQINSQREDGRPCDMDVKVLPDGALLRISQFRGKGARGCRLDPSALEAAVSAAQAQLGQGADVLIINKFGKHEAEGRGFRDVIAAALAADVPVIVGLSPLNKMAFNAFTGGEAAALALDLDALTAWLNPLLPKRVEAS
jgi:nucleoside-triphosphatase THEP1